MSINTLREPKSYVEASKFECWNQAIQAEWLALERISTWQLVEAQPNIKPIGCKWIYKVKFHANGSIKRFEARLMAKGFNKIKGLNYVDTYSPVAKMTTVRMVIALTIIHNWFVKQLDINNAFLHGDM